MPMKKKIFKISKEKKDVLADYLEYKKIVVSAKSKIEAYRYFISYFLNHSKKQLEDYGEHEIVDFLNSLNKMGYKVGTINAIKWMMKSFICWHYADFSSRFRNLDRILKQQKTMKTYSPEQMLTKEDIEKLVQEEPELRWKTFFLLYFFGGFRPIETCQLKWKDITFDNEGAFVKTFSKKNNKEFQKYIPENVVFYLRKLKERSHDSEYLFPTKRTRMKNRGVLLPVGDKPMTRSGVYQRLIPLAKRVLGKHVNPYILRHSVGTILYNREDLKDDDVAQQMGHSKAMKQTYNNLSIDKIRARMKRIYIKAEDLPDEKKHKLELQIDVLNRKLESQDKTIGALLEAYRGINKNVNTPDLN